MSFATSIYPENFATSKPIDSITFMGKSVPHYAQISQLLAQHLDHYPKLPLRQAAYADYARVHTDEYLATLEKMANDEPVEKRPKLSIECTGLEYCIPGYLYKLGGMMEAVDRMRNGRLQAAYCFGTGHHAHPDWGHGYSILHPLAAAVRYAQEQQFVRVLIVDWDIHHGDGTQAIFANDPTVYCLSIHSGADLYMALAAGIRPGTTTVGEALGHCNIPLLDPLFDDRFAAKMGLEGDFYRAHESLPMFRQALQQLPWLPDLICIFSGYDSHKDDCGKEITNWTNDDYRTLTRSVLQVADKANCPVLSVHGGGYQIDVAVNAAVVHVEELAAWAQSR